MPSGRLIVAANSGHSIHRVLFVVLAVLGGSGILIYLAMWIIVPNQPEAAA